LATELVKAEPSLFSRVYRDLLREFAPAIGENRWRKLFEWPWPNPESHVGYALIEDDGRVVGYAGTIFSNRVAGGRTHRMCNISTWVVKDSHRSAAMSLIMPILLRRELTITNLTPTSGVGEIFTRLGFRVLESHDRIILPRPWWFLGRDRGVRVSRGAAEVEAVLSAAQTPVLRDHASLCEHLVASTPNGDECYLIFSRARRWKSPAARIHYISSVSAFVRTLPTLQAAFVRMGLPILVCDDRLLNGAPVPLSRRVPIPHPRLLRSPDFEPSEISNLYSELVLLEL
jgi:hypothetical protein